MKIIFVECERIVAYLVLMSLILHLAYNCLAYNCTGQRKTAEVTPRRPGLYDVSYLPESEGPCRVDVTYGGQPVPHRCTILIIYLPLTFYLFIIFIWQQATRRRSKRSQPTKCHMGWKRAAERISKASQAKLWPGLMCKMYDICKTVFPLSIVWTSRIVSRIDVGL